MLKIAATAFTIISIASSASAVTFTGTTVGNWTNPQASEGFALYNFDQGNATYSESYAVWGYYEGCGTCTPYSNFWAFDGIGSDGDPAWATVEDSVFHFGDLSYRNGSVYGHDFTGSGLSIDLSISAPVAVVKTFDFDLEVENVPNDTGNAATDGDIARITGAVADQYFTFGGTDYTLELMGFSRDGGLTLASEFQVAEASTDTVGLYGRITEVTPVPVPASMSLALLGMVPFAYGARRRRKLKKIA